MQAPTRIKIEREDVPSSSSIWKVSWSASLSSAYVYKVLEGIASLRINLSLKTVQLSPPIFGHFCEYIILLFCP